MEQQLTEKQVEQIAHYARIYMDPNEIQTMTKDLNAIVSSLDIILTYNLEDVEPTFHPIGGLSNIMREDVCTESFTQKEALKNAPEQKNGCFYIPSILGEGVKE